MKVKMFTKYKKIPSITDVLLNFLFHPIIKKQLTF